MRITNEAVNALMWFNGCTKTVKDNGTRPRCADCGNVQEQRPPRVLY